MDNANHSFLLSNFLDFVPMFSSALFYISVTAIGFWGRPGSRTFVELAFLMPISTIVNIFLKHIFILTKLNQRDYLLPVEYMFSFPSGYVMAATVFWGSLILRFRHHYFIILFVCFIVLVMIERVYVNVHSIESVIGGVIFGIMTLMPSCGNYIQKILNHWIYKRHFSYWVMLIITSAAYFVIVEYNMYSKKFVVSMSILVGLGLSFNNIKTWKHRNGILSINHLIAILISYIGFIILYLAIPIFSLASPFYYVSLIFKYALLSFVIFTILPKFQIAMIQVNYRKIEEN